MLQEPSTDWVIDGLLQLFTEDLMLVMLQSDISMEEVIQIRKNGTVKEE